jgi:hypothetical protein
VCALVLQAQRAEVDSGSLLDELQQLIQAKADVAQQRADLNRYAAAAVRLARLLAPCAGQSCRVACEVELAVTRELHSVAGQPLQTCLSEQGQNAFLVRMEGCSQ